ncbi:hypothetical protein HJC23_011443 [Cyclotella cryptica]|uniref:Enoyl reductase (ER) domain-containing protein n=1 Tax=Cyclotella cryptica TaxID=29204 RepID=A0ABD3NV29_9STRA|eukprot:CCRYP_019526-RA/>CCRYP_019526-RA protein AED:0.04 eAED:0.04 QI:204/1/1/1/1/1/3/596/957
MKTSSSSAASASTLTYESDISSRRSHYLNGYPAGHNDHAGSHSRQAKQEEARLFDLVLKKLETVRMVKARERHHSHSGQDRNQHDGDYNAVERHVQRRDDLRSNRRSNHAIRSEHDESVVTDTEGSCVDDSSDGSSRGRFSSRELMPIHRAENDHEANDRKPKHAIHHDYNSFSEEQLPDAILRLDRRHAIPRPRHKNDLLVEIDACTIEKRSLANRPGVRSSIHPTPIETIAVDCIGRVVQLTTHARAIHGVELEDRVAALYPFDYSDTSADKRGRRCGVGKRKELGRYALVDAGFIVTVPKDVDGALAATLIRLYMTAFQSIQMGILHNTPTTSHDRYDLSQLEGQSILIQNGHTELGLAVIDIAITLGAQQIFATGPSEHHSRLRCAGATPLGKKTFGWELFLTEKLNLVLIQDLPNMEIFEQFVRLLDDDHGSIVKINHWPQRQGGYDENELNDDSIVATENVGCDGGLHLGDLAEKARFAFEEAKFHLRLACCSQFLTYDGAWASSKEDPSLWKEDLRFLLALLSEGNLRPRAHERICLENVAETQDRIELYGKGHSIVCLPFKTATETAFAEDRDMNVNDSSMLQENSPAAKGRVASKGHGHYNSSMATCSTTKRSEVADHGSGFATMINDNDEIDFAVASGYVRGPIDVLSDFHYLNDSRNRPHRELTKNGCSVDFQPSNDYKTCRQQEFCLDNDFSSGVSNSAIPVHTHHMPPSQTKASDNSYQRSFQNSPPPSTRIEETKSRHSRIIQRQKVAKERRFKTQQHDNHNDACRRESAMQSEPVQIKSDSSNNLQNSRSQWRKLRRDARAKSRANERSKLHELVQCETGPTTKNGTCTMDGSETSKCFERAQSEAVKAAAYTDDLQDIEENNGNESERVCVKDSSSPGTSPNSTLADLHSSHILESEKTMTETGTGEVNVTRAANIVQEHEETSSFHSLMIKWKSIEDRIK